MAQYEDLTPCTYWGDREGLLAVGWLESPPFAQGKLEPTVVKRLKALLKSVWQPCFRLGSHECTLCGRAHGHRNLFLPGRSGALVAPELIVHYIEKHDYLPPIEFQEAVLNCPKQGSPEHFKALRASGLDVVAMSMPHHRAWPSIAREQRMSEATMVEQMRVQARKLRMQYFPDESGDFWKHDAQEMGLRPEEIERLERQGVTMGAKRYRQIFEAYKDYAAKPIFITSDSILYPFHGLVQESLRQMEELHARRLPALLAGLWSRLPPEPTGNRAEFVLGVARALLGTPAEELGRWGPDMVEQAARVRRAEGAEQPPWWRGSEPVLLDYAHYRPRGFYTNSPLLEDYFRAVRWLQSIPFRLDQDEELKAAWRLSVALWYEPEYLELQHAFTRMAVSAHLDFQPIGPRAADAAALADFRAWHESRGSEALQTLGSEADQTIELRLWVGMALPESAFFQQLAPRSLPDPRWLCAVLETQDRPGLNLRPSVYLHDAYLDCLACLLQASDPAAPEFMHGEAWHRKSMQTTLGSWAQIRHSLVLQAFDLSTEACLPLPPQIPGFVEPVPIFYRRLGELVARFRDYFDGAGVFVPDLKAWRDDYLARHPGESEDWLTRVHDEAVQRDDIHFYALCLGRFWMKPMWERLQQLCEQLASLAEKQLRHDAFDSDDHRFFNDYGDALSSLALELAPNRDVPLIADVAHDPDERMYLQVGVGMPQALYALHPSPDGPLLCSGAVIPYAQFHSDYPMNDSDWKERFRVSWPRDWPEWLQF